MIEFTSMITRYSTDRSKWRMHHATRIKCEILNLLVFRTSCPVRRESVYRHPAQKTQNALWRVRTVDLSVNCADMSMNAMAVTAECSTNWANGAGDDKSERTCGHFVRAWAYARIPNYSPLYRTLSSAVQLRYGTVGYSPHGTVLCSTALYSTVYYCTSFWSHKSKTHATRFDNHESSNVNIWRI